MESLALAVVVICLGLTTIGIIAGAILGIFAARDQWAYAGWIAATVILGLAVLAISAPAGLLIWPIVGLVIAVCLAWFYLS